MIEIVLTLTDLVLVADCVIAMEVVSTVITEVVVHDISRDLVSDCFLDVFLEPEFTLTEVFRTEQDLTMMDKQVCPYEGHTTSLYVGFWIHCAATYPW